MYMIYVGLVSARPNYGNYIICSLQIVHVCVTEHNIPGISIYPSQGVACSIIKYFIQVLHLHVQCQFKYMYTA